MKYQIKFAINNLKKFLFTSVLNIAGLTSAFAAFIIIMLYVWNENHFDRYNKNANEIYRVELKSPGSSKFSMYLAGPTGQTLVDGFPEVLASTTYMAWGKWGEIPVSWETQNGQVKSFEDYSYSDQYLTDVFTFNIKYGSKNRPLSEPNSALISESFAIKAWGNTDPTGKLLFTGDEIYTIAAVFEDLPENSVVQCPIILKMPSKGWIAEAFKTWGVVNYPQFILVKPGTNIKILNDKINSIAVFKENYSYFNRGQETVSLLARPLLDLRFNDQTSETPMFNTNSRMFVSLLFWVGILILLVAIINYINFATANIPRRLKGITISRIIGGTRKNSIAVFMVETVFLFLISFLMAFSIAYLINKNFAFQIFGYILPFSGKLFFWSLMMSGILLLGFVSGLYPAIVSTAGNLVENLKKPKANKGLSFRGILTVSQFAATIALITSSVFVVKQVLFMEKANLGFNKNNTIVLSMTDDLKKNYKSFENKLKQSSYISGMSCSRAVPGRAQEMQVFEVSGKTCQLWYWAVDDNYIDMMGFSFAEGRNFLKNSDAENRNMICNETALKTFGWHLGDKIGNGILVGVLKDFNFISLREKVEPFAFWLSRSDQPFSNVSIKLTGNNVSETISFIKKVYEEVSPNMAFRYFFLDDHLNLLYNKETQQVKLIFAFSILSIIISILGILGLSTFICQSNIKEIGIRKVNGAKVSEILTMLNKDFVKWVVLAFVIASPIAWYAMHKWLENFAYKTNLSWWIFALAGMLALGIAVLTVSWQSWRAATRNPVEALRYE